MASKMNEDHILHEIRKLTINDDMSIDVVLKKIICIASEYVQESERIVSKNKGITMGNILSLLLSAGVHYATSNAVKYNITERRVGIYPSHDLFFYATYTQQTGWKGYIISQNMYLRVDDINVVSLMKDMVSDFDIKYGMLYCRHTSSNGNVQLYIIPSRNHIIFRDDGLFVQALQSSSIRVLLPVKGVSSLPQHVLDWLYPL